MAQESVVQVAPDSTGKKIRNIQLDVVQPDGSTATVQMQVVASVDADGRLIVAKPVQGFSFAAVLDEQVLEQLVHLNDKLNKIMHILSLEFGATLEEFNED